MLRSGSVRTAFVWLALVCPAGLLAPAPSRADGLSVLSVGLRARIGEKNILGEPQPESFKAYDVVADIRSPWGWYSRSGWGLGFRLLGSVGALHAVGSTALVASAIPIVALGRQDGRFTLDAGAGVGLLSRQQFGVQDLGGPAQFALTVGLGVPLYRRIGVGYRYLHYSDASFYGPHNTGVDFHMLELTYWL